MPLANKDNGVIIDAIRGSASLEYQNRIPLSTEAGIDATVAAIVNFQQTRNEFVDALVNRIGSVIAHDMSWQNPLAKFKKPALTFGNTIEELQVGLIQAREYNTDRDALEKDLFGQHTPDVRSSFHTLNRRNMYPITVNEGLLRQAFLEPQGLANLVGQILQSPITSDQWDEFLLTCKLFAIYEKNGGFFHVNVPDVSVITSNADNAKVALRKMRSMAGNLSFLSTAYNAAHMPVYAKPEDLELFITPEYNAAIDVEALAAAFNIDRSNMVGHINLIPQDKIGIDGVQAIMTTRDFFMIADNRLENSSQWNAARLSSNYFMHHWETISASRFVPAVAFWTGKDDDIITVKTVVNGISDIVAKDGEDSPVETLTRGNKYQLSATVTTAPTGGTNTGVAYSITKANSQLTRVSATGIIEIGPDETATAITVKADTTWIDPAKPADSSKSVSKDFTLTGDIEKGWGQKSVPVSPGK